MKQYKRITKQIGLIYGVQVFDFVLMFLLFVVLTRSLSEYGFGIYSLLNVTILFLTGLLGFGLNDFVIRDLAGKKESIKRKSFSQIFTFLSLVTLVGVILLITLGRFILNFLNYKAIFLPLAMAILCSVSIVLGSITAHYAYAKKQAVKATFIESLLRSVWALPIIFLSFLYSLTINLIFLTKLIFTIVVIFCTILYFKKRKLKFFNRINKKYIKKALVFGIPLSTLVIFQWVITASDRYILGLFHSAVAVGKYSYIYSLLNFILVFSTSAIIMTIYPHIVENYNKENKQKSNFLLNASLKYILILILPALTGFFFLSKELITMISGTKYINAIPIIPFLIIFPLFEGLNAISRKVLVLQNKTKTIAIIYLEGMALNIILNIILIPKYHYFGAAIATSITYIILFALFFAKTKNYIQFDYKYLKLPRIILSVIIMTLAIAFIHPQNILTKLATICFGITVYLLSLYGTKAYVKEEMKLIRSFLPKKGLI